MLSKPMIYTLKVLVSALIIVLVNEVSKRSTALAAVLLALPIVSVIAFTWEWMQTGDAERLASLSVATFWFVLPTLPMFLLLAWLLRQGYSYYLALGLCVLLTAVLFTLTQYLQQRLA